MSLICALLAVAHINASTLPIKSKFQYDNEMDTRSDVTSIEVKSVKQFNKELKTLMESTYRYIWIRGEIGSLKLHSSGHTYFSLKEEDEVINAICWRGTVLSSKLEEGAVFECYGRITIYPGRSSYQIIVQEARAVNAVGNILLQLEELKQRLLKEGLFDASRKQQIVQYPEKLAVLTSPTGAVLHDIMHRITDRYPCCTVFFIPIAVQGAEAAESILKGLEKADTLNVDTIILARGGGSMEDLWVFNDEQVVRKVANMKTPTISAIGHETDTTLVDYAASLRAPTPTAAAELAVPDKKMLQEATEKMLRTALNVGTEKLKQYHALLDNFADYKFAYQNTIGSFEQKIDNTLLNLGTLIADRISAIKVDLGILEPVTQIFEQFQQKTMQYSEIAKAIVKMRLQEAHGICDQTKTFVEEKEIELKEKVMITDSSNKKITSANALKELDQFTLKFLDGNVDAKPVK